MSHSSIKPKVGVIGSGDVAKVLAEGFIKHGYEVRIGSRTPDKLNEWIAKVGHAGSVSVGSFEEAAQFGDIIVLAVKGSVAESALNLCGSKNLKDKIIIDPTNPISDAAPINGVLSYFTSSNDSLMERLQRHEPTARFVKAFSCVGGPHMVNPDFGSVKPTMFICGNNADAKLQVTKILFQFGWETEDMGAVEAARGIEPLCILWCIRGMKDGQWNHAFKLLKK